MPGLTLTRRDGQEIVIAEGLIVISIRQIKGSAVRINIEAPRDIDVWRGEVFARRQEETKGD